MGKTRLPESLRQFVERQTTMPVTDLWDGDRKEERSPYGSYWYRAVACILLSGRVQAKIRRHAQHDRRETRRQGGELQPVPHRADRDIPRRDGSDPVRSPEPV